MVGRSRRRAIVAGASVTLVVVAAAVALVWSLTPEVEAHGSTQVPASRVYSCRFEQPDNPMCARAAQANPQAIYDWMEVNIPDADGRHQQLIPDGELCSAGRDKYAAFDEPGDWPVTRLTPNSSGEYEIVYTNTAPHATAYYRVMLSRPGFDARTDRLGWDDLEVVYESGSLPASEENRFTMALPERQAPAILYVIWQRSDSPEAFYACSDVTIGGGSPTPTTTSTTPTTSEPTPTTTPPPGSDAPTSPVHGVTVGATTTAAWDGGACIEIRVGNTTSSAQAWEVHYQPPGEVDTLWNARAEEADGHTVYTGESWNEQLDAGESTTFGMCVTGR